MTLSCLKLLGYACIGMALFTFLPSIANAQPDLQLLKVEQDAAGGSAYSVSLQVLLFMTLLSVLPAALITMTSFTRVLVVLAILRQALGTGQTPSNQIILGLSLFLTFFIMSPVFDDAYQNAAAPYMAEEISLEEALEAGEGAFREFMFAQTREQDLMLFAELGGYGSFASTDDVPLRVLLPSFLISELKTAFQIGFLIFIPFLVIDLIVASVLMAMGMMMLSPVLISLPFKIMLFVLIDGWSLIVGTIVSSFVR